jgi:hypothetical protein
MNASSKQVKLYQENNNAKATQSALQKSENKKQKIK